MRLKTLFRPTLSLGLVLAGLTTSACDFSPSGYLNPDDLLPFRDDTVPVAPTSANRSLVYESPGLLAVFHGETCAEGDQVHVRVQESLPLPKDLDRGTVIANGWNLRYLDSDHHVKGMGTGIGGIVVTPGQLQWEAAGVLADDDFNDGYAWCYTYTAVAWNSRQLLAEVDHGDMGHAFRDREWTNGTALLPVPGYLENKAFAGLEEVAVLPRGFASIWAGTNDHHILQFAYKNDGGEVYIEGKKKYGNNTEPSAITAVGTGFVSWESTGFMKDNDLQRDQFFMELVTGLGGRDVGVLNFPFTLAPREDSSWLDGCASIGPFGEVTEIEHTVESVPFQFAIPVLSGWDLAYSCGDEHVTEIGAWIPKWEWLPGTSPGGGTLKYTVSSILRDKDGAPHFHSRTQIKVLGFRPIVPVMR